MMGVTHGVCIRPHSCVCARIDSRTPPSACLLPAWPAQEEVLLSVCMAFAICNLLASLSADNSSDYVCE